MLTPKELTSLVMWLRFSRDMQGNSWDEDDASLLEKVEQLQAMSTEEGPVNRGTPRDLWITVALFDGRVAHTEEMWIKAFSEESAAWDEARKNVHGAREAGYTGTGTAIFEVDVDTGRQAMMSVLVGDKA